MSEHANHLQRPTLQSGKPKHVQRQAEKSNPAPETSESLQGMEGESGLSSSASPEVGTGKRKLLYSGKPVFHDQRKDQTLRRKIEAFARGEKPALMYQGKVYPARVNRKEEVTGDQSQADQSGQESPSSLSLGHSHTPAAAPPVVQPKLEIGPVDDPLEREADEMAERVVSNAADGSSGADQPLPPADPAANVQRKCADCEEEEVQRKPVAQPDADQVQRKCADCEREEEQESVIRRRQDASATGAGFAAPQGFDGQLSQARGQGAPLGSEVRQEMEGKFGADFSRVRLHTDSRAVQLSRDIQAQAFTSGSDIFMGSRWQGARNTEGKRLLAHELTHVVQQGGAVESVVRRKEEGEQSLKISQWLYVNYPRFATAVKAENKAEGEFIMSYGNMLYHASNLSVVAYYRQIDRMYADKLGGHLINMGHLLSTDSRAFILQSIETAQARAQENIVVVAKQQVKSGQSISVPKSAKNAIVANTLKKVEAILAEQHPVLSALVTVFKEIGSEITGMVNIAYRNSHANSLIKVIKGVYDSQPNSDRETLRTKEHFAFEQLKELLFISSTLLERMQGVISSGGLFETYDAGSALEVVRLFAQTASVEERKAVLQDPKTKDFIWEVFDDDELYEVYQLLAPEHMADVVFARIRREPSIDKVATVLLDVDVATRKFLYSNYYEQLFSDYDGFESGKGGAKPDPNTEMYYIYHICTGNEALALGAAMYLATQGTGSNFTSEWGTYDALLDQVVEKTGEFRAERIEVANKINQFDLGESPEGAEYWALVGKERTPEENEKYRKLLIYKASLQKRAQDIGDIDKLLLTPKGGTNTGLASMTFLGMLAGDVDEDEFNNKVMQMGGDPYSIAKSILFNHHRYDLEVIWKALSIIPIFEQRKRLMLEYDAFMNSKEAMVPDSPPMREVDDIGISTTSWSRPRRHYDYSTNPKIVNLVEGNSYLHALDQLEEAWDGSTDEAKIVSIVLNMDPVDYGTFINYGKQYDLQDPIAIRSREVYYLISQKMDLDERWLMQDLLENQTPSALAATKYGTGEWYDGWIQDLPSMYLMFDKLSDEERFKYRLGYLASRSNLSLFLNPEVAAQEPEFAKSLMSMAPGAISAFRSIDDRISSLGDTDYRKALDHLMGDEPTALEFASKAIGPFMHAFIGFSLMDGKRQTQMAPGFMDLFTESRKKGNTFGLMQSAYFKSAAEGGTLDWSKAAALSNLMDKQSEMFYDYRATEAMVADIAATAVAVVVAVAVTIGTGGLGAPAAGAALAAYLPSAGTIVLAAAASATTKVALKEAMLGSSYDMWAPEMWHDAGMAVVDGATTAISMGIANGLMGMARLSATGIVDGIMKATDFSLKGIGKGFVEASLRSGIEGGLMGMFHGAAESALDQETWRKGIWNGLKDMGLATLRTGVEWGAMGMAMGGPIDLLGRGVTRIKVGPALRQLEERGLSRTVTDGWSPTQVLRSLKALELVEAGQAGEATKLLAVLERDGMALEHTNMLRKQVGLPEGRVPVTAEAKAGEARGELGNSARERFGRENDLSDPISESELAASGAKETSLPNGHKLWTLRRRCYLCSDCSPISALLEGNDHLIDFGPSFRKKLSELADLLELGLVDRYNSLYEQLEYDLAKAAREFELTGNFSEMVIPTNWVDKPFDPSRVNIFTEFSGELAFGNKIIVFPGKPIFIFGRVGNGARGSLSTTRLANALARKGVPRNQIRILTDPPKAGWETLPVREQNRLYWEEINKGFCDEAAAIEGPIQFIHDPRLPENIMNKVAESGDSDFLKACEEQGIIELEVFLHMEYEYFRSLGYEFRGNLMIKR